MPRITLSYRRSDSLDITGRIFDRLAAHFGREAVFRDIDNIPVGVDFRRHIGGVLNETDIILAVVGPHWMGPSPEQNRLINPADPVRVEIEIALRIDKPLIPVLVSNATMPSPERLPESVQDFSYRNAMEIDSGQDFENDVRRLISSIETTISPPKDPAAEHKDTAEPVANAPQQSPNISGSINGSFATQSGRDDSSGFGVVVAILIVVGMILAVLVVASRGINHPVEQRQPGGGYHHQFNWSPHQFYWFRHH
jgi:TIR domain